MMKSFYVGGTQIRILGTTWCRHGTRKVREIERTSVFGNLIMISGLNWVWDYIPMEVDLAKSTCVPLETKTWIYRRIYKLAQEKAAGVLFDIVANFGYKVSSAKIHMRSSHVQSISQPVKLFHARAEKRTGMVPKTVLKNVALGEQETNNPNEAAKNNTKSTETVHFKLPQEGTSCHAQRTFTKWGMWF